MQLPFSQAIICNTILKQLWFFAVFWHLETSPAILDQYISVGGAVASWLVRSTPDRGRTQFSRALLLMRFSARTRTAKTNMSSIKRSFYLFKTSIICVIFLYYWTQYIDGFSLLGKVTTQKNPAILSFSFLPKEPFKCSACAVARKIETDCFCRNLPISNDPVVRISRNLAKQ